MPAGYKHGISVAFMKMRKGDCVKEYTLKRGCRDQDHKGPCSQPYDLCLLVWLVGKPLDGFKRQGMSSVLPE